MTQGGFMQVGKDFTKTGTTIHVEVRIHGFGDAIAEKDQRIARPELQTGRGVLSSRHQANWIGALGERLVDLSAAEKKRRGMAGVDEFQLAVQAEDPEKHGGVAGQFNMLAQKLINVIDDSRRFNTDSHRRKRPLEHGRKERGTKTFSGNVGDDE